MLLNGSSWKTCILLQKYHPILFASLAIQLQSSLKYPPMAILELIMEYTSHDFFNTLLLQHLKNKDVRTYKTKKSLLT